MTHRELLQRFDDKIMEMDRQYEEACQALGRALIERGADQERKAKAAKLAGELLQRRDGYAAAKNMMLEFIPYSALAQRDEQAVQAVEAGTNDLGAGPRRADCRKHGHSGEKDL